MTYESKVLEVAGLIKTADCGFNGLTGVLAGAIENLVFAVIVPT